MNKHLLGTGTLFCQVCKVLGPQGAAPIPNRLATKQTTFRTSSDPSDILPLVTVLGVYYVAEEKGCAG